MNRRMERILVVPQPDDRVSFIVDGRETVTWHFAARYPRPFLYPLLDPHGHPVTRMGHPAAPDHDHHRSVWFGHQSVAGVDFWAERGGSQQIRQTVWIQYQDGDDVGLAAVRLGWFDAHGVKLLSQDLIIAFIPLDNDEYVLELQSEFRPEPLELVLGRTNFGFLGVRVARGVSALFGFGKLRDSEGREGERQIFGERARWVDYTGITAASAEAGITYMDHPDNPRHPSRWHVRDDGWMAASFCMSEPFVLSRGRSLRLRYALYVHAGIPEASQIERIWERFARWPAWHNSGPRGPHRTWYSRGC